MAASQAPTTGDDYAEPFTGTKVYSCITMWYCCNWLFGAKRSRLGQ